MTRHPGARGRLSIDQRLDRLEAWPATVAAVALSLALVAAALIVASVVAARSRWPAPCRDGT